MFWCQSTSRPPPTPPVLLYKHESGEYVEGVKQEVQVDHYSRLHLLFHHPPPSPSQSSPPSLSNPPHSAPLEAACTSCQFPLFSARNWSLLLWKQPRQGGGGDLPHCWTCVHSRKCVCVCVCAHTCVNECMYVWIWIRSFESIYVSVDGLLTCTRAVATHTVQSVSFDFSKIIKKEIYNES